MSVVVVVVIEDIYAIDPSAVDLSSVADGTPQIDIQVSDQESVQEPEQDSDSKDSDLDSEDDHGSDETRRSSNGVSTRITAWK
jgi:hypothetical protein